MAKHLLSFLRSPIGYIANLLATLTLYIPVPDLLDRWVCQMCETFCIADGVQDDPLF